MKEKIRAGFVGCGSHATLSIFPSLRFAPIELVAVCDLQADRAEYAARVFGAREIMPSVDELLARDDLDAVFVVGPPTLHTKVSIQAMRAGKHVFSEKPPGETLLYRLYETVRRQLCKSEKFNVGGFLWPSQPDSGALRSLESEHFKGSPYLYECAFN